MEADLVQGFPFSIPREYDALPRLLGRAQVRLHTTAGDLLTVVDGYNAPLTAGAFVDLVQRGFYNGLGFNRAEAFYILQSGDPEGEAGWICGPPDPSVAHHPPGNPHCQRGTALLQSHL